MMLKYRGYAYVNFLLEGETRIKSKIVFSLKYVYIFYVFKNQVHLQKSSPKRDK